MRNSFTLIPVVLLSLIFGLGWRSDYPVTQPENISSQSTEIIPMNIVQEMIGQVNLERALIDLRRLSGEEPIDGTYTIINRWTGSEGLQKAKDYVIAELVRMHYSVDVLDWSRDGHADQNIVARKRGFIYPEEEIYFVAHLDSRNLDGVDRSPGADDNASGVVDILELARVLSTHSLTRTIVLLFDTGEEYGTLGVRSYLDQLSPSELSAIKYVVNLDMVSYDANNDGVMELWSGDHPASLVLTQMMSEIILAYQLDLVPRLVVGCG